MDTVQLPACLPTSRLKRAVKIALGQVATALDPKYAAAVAAGDLPAHMSLRERLLMAALVDKYKREGKLEELAPVHAWFWQSEQAVAYHERAKDLLHVTWKQHQSAIVQPLKVLVERPQSPYTKLVEIGCGSGFVLADLAERLPRLEELVGLDMSVAQTEINRGRHERAELRYEAGDANAWVPEHGRPGTIFLTVGGVYEYFPQASVETLFAHIGSKLRPAVIALIEPVPDDYDLIKETESREYGLEHSMGHNYPMLLRRAGFALSYQREHRLNDTRFISVVAERP